MLQLLRENRRWQGFLLILPALLVLGGLLVLPLGLTVVTSFAQRDADGNVVYTFTLGNYWRLLGFTETGWDSRRPRSCSCWPTPWPISLPVRRNDGATCCFFGCWSPCGPIL